MTMIDSTSYNNKSFSNEAIPASTSPNRILKKSYQIADKIIIVIDESLVQKLAIDPENTWFEEEEMNDGIFLRIRRILQQGIQRS